MYSVQKGVIPVITSIISFMLPAGVFVLDMRYILENINTRIPEITGNSTNSVWLVVAIYFFSTMLIPMFFGMLLASIFPSIEVRRDGIRFFYWGFFGSKIKWDEIDSLIYYPNGYVILKIDKRGLFLFNGLYFNQLQAMHVKSLLPILIFSPGLEHREEILREILEKSSPRVVRKIG